MSDIAAEKKRAEVESRQSFADFAADIKRLFDGRIELNKVEESFLHFEHDFNIDMGLRHELEND